MARKRRMVELGTRIAILSTGALLGFRGLSLGLSPWAGDDPLRSMSWRELLAWGLDPESSAKIVAAVVLAYGLSYVVTRRLSLAGLAIWAFLLGCYLSVVVTVDLVTKVDEFELAGFTGGPVGGIVKAVILAVLLPAVIAVAVRLAGLAVEKRAT